VPEEQRNHVGIYPLLFCFQKLATTKRLKTKSTLAICGRAAQGGSEIICKVLKINIGGVGVLIKW
jgi:hypothetical protein